jgi:hypothetical protein
VLIEPRQPPEQRINLWRKSALPVTAANVVGGHAATGDEIVPLDEDALVRLAAGITPGSHLVVAAVGSLVNENHESRAAEILRINAHPASITQSRFFSSGSLLIRENTAVHNALLLTCSDELADLLTAAVARGAGPGVPAYVATNDGGCSPLARLPVSPVHCLNSAIAGELVGAGAILGGPDDPVVASQHPGLPWDVMDALPALTGTTTMPDGTILASTSVRVSPLLPPALPHPAAVTDDDLVALGAAMAPLTYIYNQVVRVAGVDDVGRALHDGESRARTVLVAAGADPATVRIPERRVQATAYAMAHMVTIRVRGIAPLPGAGGGS